MPNNDSTKGKQNNKRQAPKLGETGYKTPTQLRNARKRRKLKHGSTTDGKASSASTIGDHQDPSLRYIADPQNAPIVQNAKRFFAQQSSKFDVFVGPMSDWRTVAKLAVRMSSGCLRIGLFVPGSHDLMEVPHCQAHHPRINSAVEVLQKKCRNLSIQAYNETTGQGNLRHMAINVERSTGKQQITLVWKEGGHESSKELLHTLCTTMIKVTENKDNHSKLELHSLWVHYNNTWKHSNSIFDRDGRWEKVYGETNVVEYLKLDAGISVPLQFPPQVFRQANIDAFTNIVAKIRAWLIRQRDQHGSIRTCLELYGGVGTIGLHIADLVKKNIVSSDENPFNKACFEHALEKLEVASPRKRCEEILYESKNATEMVRNSTSVLQEADLIVLDPPRKGLDSDVVNALCLGTSAKYLVYVSCGFDAFCRDYETLINAGGWKLDSAEGHVLFPGSDAIETLAFFTRAT